MSELRLAGNYINYSQSWGPGFQNEVQHPFPGQGACAHAPNGG
jgi:hypothetical protein